MILSALRCQDEWDDKTVQSQSFSENQDQNHTDKNFILLCICSDTCVTDDSDC